MSKPNITTKASRVSNNANTASNSNLVEVKPLAPQYIKQIVKDENGLIAMGNLRIEGTERTLEGVQLTAASLGRALTENIVNSSIPVIDELIKSAIEDAVQDSRVILKQHTTNRLSEVNELFRQLQEANMSKMKEIYAKRKVKALEAAEFDSFIDIYNLGGNTPTYNASTIEAQVVDDEDEEEDLDY
jgi:hypothetical protein